MLCKGFIEEPQGKKACWLPADIHSPFQLCRRCHFHRVTEMLDSFTRTYQQGIPHNPLEIYFSNRTFLQDLLHPAREQALLNLLSCLFANNKIQMNLLVEKLRVFSVFSIFITKRIQAHQPGPRCGMYRQFLLDEKIYTSENLCWNCWSCIAWTLRQKNLRLIEKYTQHFGLSFQKLTFQMFSEVGPPTFVDLFVSLYLLNKSHHLRLLSHHMFHTFPLEDYTSFLTLFFQQPAVLSIFFEDKQRDYLPLPLQEKAVVETFRTKIKQGIKRRTNLYKEDLMIKTWHPHRLFPWCLDIEELADFAHSGITGEEGMDSIS
jgi:hypothetical protein